MAVLGPVGALCDVCVLQIQTRGLRGRRAGQEDVLFALGTLKKQTVSHLKKGQISEAVVVSVVSNMRDVTEVCQWEADHVDRQHLFPL